MVDKIVSTTALNSMQRNEVAEMIRDWHASLIQRAELRKPASRWSRGPRAEGSDMTPDEIAPDASRNSCGHCGELEREMERAEAAEAEVARLRAAITRFKRICAGENEAQMLRARYALFAALAPKEQKARELMPTESGMCGACRAPFLPAECPHRTNALSTVGGVVPCRPAWTFDPALGPPAKGNET